MRDPRETMRRLRLAEIGLGALLVVAGLTAGAPGGWRWVIVGCGIFSMLPVSGATAILRRAERNPNILIWDPERRKARAPRITAVVAASEALIAGAIGYLIDGWTLAILMAAGVGIVGAVITGITLRRL
jgi:hypothetical protein